MWASYRNSFVVALVLTVIAGCESPVPEPSESTDGGGSAPTTGGPVAMATINQDDILATLARIEKLVATAVDSPVFAPEPEPEVVEPVIPKKGPGGGPSTPEGSGGGKYKVVPVVSGGTITGQITFEGKLYDPKVFKIEKTPEVCGKEDRLLQEVTVTDGNLKDVVLALQGIAAGKPYASHIILGPPPGTRGGESTGTGNAFTATTIQPKKCIFGAFTGVIADGAEMQFDNQDPVKHSPHTYFVKGRVRKSDKNQDLEGNGKLVFSVKFKKKYKIYKLECDQHPHMQNWFYRVENPYYAFSAADGTFNIDNVPPGNYTLIAWHPILGEQQADVTISANGNTDVPFKFSSKRR